MDFWEHMDNKARHARAKQQIKHDAELETLAEQHRTESVLITMDSRITDITILEEGVTESGTLPEHPPSFPPSPSDTDAPEPPTGAPTIPITFAPTPDAAFDPATDPEPPNPSAEAAPASVITIEAVRDTDKPVTLTRSKVSAFIRGGVHSPSRMSPEQQAKVQSAIQEAFPEPTDADPPLTLTSRLVQRFILNDPALYRELKEARKHDRVFLDILAAFPE